MLHLLADIRADIENAIAKWIAFYTQKSYNLRSRIFGYFVFKDGGTEILELDILKADTAIPYDPKRRMPTPDIDMTPLLRDFYTLPQIKKKKAHDHMYITLERLMSRANFTIDDFEIGTFEVPNFYEK